MATRRVGAWLIGAKGGVATTMLTGLVALARRSLEPIGLVTATVPFAPLELVDFADIIVGGHDIRSGSLAAEAERMWTHSRAISPDLLASAAAKASMSARAASIACRGVAAAITEPASASR